MESITGLWAEVVTVWQTAVFGHRGSIRCCWRWRHFSCFCCCAGIFTRIVLATLSGITRRTKTSFDDELIAALEEPLRFVFIIIGLYTTTQVVSFPDQVELLLTRPGPLVHRLYYFLGPLSLCRPVILSDRQGLRRLRPLRPGR